MVWLQVIKNMLLPRKRTCAGCTEQVAFELRQICVCKFEEFSQCPTKISNFGHYHLKYLLGRVVLRVVLGPSCTAAAP